MRRRKLWLNIIAFAIVLICSAGLGTAMTADSSNELMIAVISLGVALIALYISLRTFYSIDEVNAISRMDGNVMENSRYHPNILRAVFRFPQSDFKETCDALMDYMNSMFDNKNKQSGAHLADNVQEVADLLVLIPYLIKGETAIQREQVSSLLKTIRYQVDNFKEISDGSCKLLEETVNLINAVFAYQKMTTKDESGPSKLLEIRGSIFINPVTCVLYYDYLGLYFLRRATSVLSNKVSPTLKEIIDSTEKCSVEDRSMALVYCNKASEAFKHAKDNIGEDMIWMGYICFNLSRTEYLKQILGMSFGDSPNNEWESHINESIRSWITSNKMIAEHFSSKYPNGEPTWLQKAFASEENFVRLTKVCMQMITHHPLTDYNGNAWLEHYSEFMETPFYKNVPKPDPMKLTDRVIEDIELILKNKS